METIIRNYRLEFILTNTHAIAWLRGLILDYVRKHRYFVSYSYLAKATGWSQPVLWQYLDAMGDEDIMNGRPRTDAFVGNDEPSNGHHTAKLYSDAHRTRWERIEYLNNEIIRLCNCHGLYFRQRVVLPNQTEKFFLRLQGMWYKQSVPDRAPVKRIQEKQKRLFDKRKKRIFQNPS